MLPFLLLLVVAYVTKSFVYHFYSCQFRARACFLYNKRRKQFIDIVNYWYMIFPLSFEVVLTAHIFILSANIHTYTELHKTIEQTVKTYDWSLIEHFSILCTCKWYHICLVLG